MLRVLLLTLQRRSELALAEWREFDLAGKTWTIPNANAKSGKGHVVPLSDWAIEELRKLKVMAAGSRYVLPSRDNSAPLEPKYITRNAIAERVLNHARERMEATYDVHDYLPEKREALER